MNSVDDFLLVEQLSLEAHEGDHNFRDGIWNLGSGSEDGSGLHFSDFGEGNTQSATSVSKHWIEFVELINLVDDLIFGEAHFLGKGFHVLLFLWQELVEGWVEHSDSDGLAVHDFEELYEIFFLELLEFLEGGLSLLLIAGDDHLSDSEDSLLLEEHVLSSAKSDTFGTELDSGQGVLWSISVGSDLELSDGVGPEHDGLEVTGFQVGFFELELTFVHLTGVTVKGDEVTFLE